MTGKDDEAIKDIIRTSPLYNGKAPGMLEQIIDQDETNILLAEIVRLLRKQVGEESEVVDVGDKGGAEYYAEKVVATEEEQELRWDFAADTVVVFFDDDIEMALQEPARPDRELNLGVQHSPATFSGTSGINARAIWVKQAPSADAQPNVQVMAIK